MGERSPVNDTNARGTFVGLTMDTSRSDLVQAVLEGVAYPNVQTVCEKMVSVTSVEMPQPELAKRYEQRYQQFRKIYPACKSLFQELVKEGKE